MSSRTRCNMFDLVQDIFNFAIIKCVISKSLKKDLLVLTTVILNCLVMIMLSDTQNPGFFSCWGWGLGRCQRWSGWRAWLPQARNLHSITCTDLYCVLHNFNFDIKSKASSCNHNNYALYCVQHNFNFDIKSKASSCNHNNYAFYCVQHNFNFESDTIN